MRRKVTAAVLFPHQLSKFQSRHRLLGCCVNSRAERAKSSPSLQIIWLLNPFPSVLSLSHCCLTLSSATVRARMPGASVESMRFMQQCARRYIGRYAPRNT